jgi:hypothetical protein
MRDPDFLRFLETKLSQAQKLWPHVKPPFALHRRTTEESSSQAPPSGAESPETNSLKRFKTRFQYFLGVTTFELHSSAASALVAHTSLQSLFRYARNGFP